MKSFSMWVEVVFVWKTKHLQQRKKLEEKQEKLFKFAVDSGKKITEIANAQV